MAFIFLSLVGDVLHQALDVHVWDLGISRLDQTGGSPSLYVSLQLGHELIGLAREFRGFNLDVRMLRVPLLTISATFVIPSPSGKRCKYLMVTGPEAAADCDAALPDDQDPRGTTTGAEHECSGDDRSNRGHPTSTACDHVNPLP